MLKNSTHVLSPELIILYALFSLIFAPTAFASDSAKSDSKSLAFSRAPNILLVLVDDLGACDLGFSGSSFHETPHIDALAEKGTVFTSAYASCAVCSPTRAALQTGKSPARLGITDWIRSKFQDGKAPETVNGVWPYETPKPGKLSCPVNPIRMELGEVTLAERLHTLGYATGYIGKWHLGPEGFFPDAQGFDVNLGGCDLGQPPSYFDPYCPDSTELKAGGDPTLRPLYRITTLKPERTGEFLTDREAREAVRFLRTAAETPERPFFLQVSHYAVHTPIMCRKKVQEKYQRKLEEMSRENPNLRKNFNGGRDDRDPNQTQNEQRNPNYAGLVESVDDAVGEILRTLEETGLSENTIVIFTSDNGGFCGVTDNFPLREGKGTPYEGGLRVPLVVYLPEKYREECVPPHESDIPVTSYDLVPTLLHLAGAPLSAAQLETQKLDGRDISGIFFPKKTEAEMKNESENEMRSDAPLFWHFPHYRQEWEPYSAVRDGHWKLIRFYTPSGNRYELYNLKRDPQEQKNLAEKRPEIVTQLDTELTQWLEKTGARIPVSAP